MDTAEITAATAAPEPTIQHDNRARFWLALVVVVQFVCLVAYLSLQKTQLPDSQLILGAEIGFVSTVLGYFFGSSSGSQSKDAILAGKG